MTLEHKMILSASGWRKIFAEDGDENSFTKKIGRENYILSALCARAFCTYLGKKLGKKNARIAVARDTRPTGSQICQAVIKTIKMCGQKVLYLDVASAPEIMAFSKKCDAFVYISASHNPVGHNGIKFGLSDGGVLEAEENRAVKEIFLSLLGKQVAEYDAFLKTLGAVDIKKILQEKKANKEKSLSYYRDFSRKVISDCTTKGRADLFFKKFVPMFLKRRITVCADFNGSARAACIDKSFFKECKIKFFSINSRPGQIAHAIIPEPENLGYVANLVEETAQALTKAKTGSKTLKASTAARASSAAPAILGYMPDCDGDRGNIVYWSERDKKAKILKAQEVFSLSVFAELNFLKERGAKKVAVCVNCPTSMRIEEIAKGFGAKVFRAEVGEANVVHLARKKRAEGWTVRILGEGSNGGTITHPESVRDPLNTVFAIAKLLAMHPEKDLDQILDSFPKYTTTGVSEKRAVLKIKTGDHAVLKSRFQKLFEEAFKKDERGLVKKYGITDWKCAITNGTKEVVMTKDKADFSKSGKGGLKILFYERGQKAPSAFIWMRGSGTEPVFRIMCDVKGSDAAKEKALLAWETKMLLQADKR